MKRDIKKNVTVISVTPGVGLLNFYSHFPLVQFYKNFLEVFITETDRTVVLT